MRSLSSQDPPSINSHHHETVPSNILRKIHPRHAVAAHACITIVPVAHLRLQFSLKRAFAAGSPFLPVRSIPISNPIQKNQSLRYKSSMMEPVRLHNGSCIMFLQSICFPVYRMLVEGYVCVVALAIAQTRASTLACDLLSRDLLALLLFACRVCAPCFSACWWTAVC